MTSNSFADAIEGSLQRREFVATLAGAAFAAVSGAAAAPTASPQSQQSSAGLLTWSQYVDLLKPAAVLLEQTWEPKSEAQRADLYRQFALNIAQGYFIYFQADAEHPDWMPFENSVFMLQPNPDAVYHLAPVRGDAIYRVTGFRGGNRVMGFAIGKNLIGMSDAPTIGYNNYDADRLTLAADGAFDVIFSKERPAGLAGDWRYLNPEAEYILIRQFAYDWGREPEARFAIERLDRPAFKPRPGTAEIGANLEQLFGGYVRRLSKWAIDLDNDVYQRGFVNKMELSHFVGNSDEWPQVYWRMIYDYQPGEALIIETDIPKQCHYWNVQIADSLFNQVELAYRESSLNGHQARLDSDGKFRGVLALEDPGIPNWLDTGGYRRGMLIGRWHRSDSQPVPTVRKVGFSELRKHLPADTPSISPAERDKILRARNIGSQMRRRW